MRLSLVLLGQIAYRATLLNVVEWNDRQGRGTSIAPRPRERFSKSLHSSTASFKLECRDRGVENRRKEELPRNESKKRHCKGGMEKAEILATAS